VFITGNNLIPFTDIFEGYYFGEIELILQKPRIHTIQATSRVELLILPRKCFDEIGESFENDYDEILINAQERMTRLEERKE
jgi:CRP-like cAMP-binding protein